MSVEGTGFLRTVAYEEEIEKDKFGNILKQKVKIETRSNTGEVLGGMNSVLGTAVGAARDLMP